MLEARFSSAIDGRRDCPRLVRATELGERLARDRQRLLRHRGLHAHSRWPTARKLRSPRESFPACSPKVRTRGRGLRRALPAAPAPRGRHDRFRARQHRANRLFIEFARALRARRAARRCETRRTTPAHPGWLFPRQPRSDRMRPASPARPRRSIWLWWKTGTSASARPPRTKSR